MRSPFEGFPNNGYLTPVYFQIEALEKYFSNPQYIVHYADYRGTIYPREECENEDEYEYIKDFGLAWNKTNRWDRAIVLFYGDILKMPVKSQCYWYSYLVNSQENYVPNDGFITNLILGDWVEDISLYQALIIELSIINQMCQAMGLPNLFRKEFSDSFECNSNRPHNFHVLLTPTAGNYYPFVETLEKMTTGNINEQVFLLGKGSLKPIDKKDSEGNNRGSLSMLSEWLCVNVVGADIENAVTKPLRKLIKERQVNAHKLYSNDYDRIYWQKQSEMLHGVYTAIRNIRLIFANHPQAKSVEVPMYIFDGEHIRDY